MAHSVCEVNLSRRELIRPDLNQNYKQLCSSQTPISKFWSGDDLPKAVKEISETNKVSKRLSYPKQGTNSKHRCNNFRRQGSSYSNRQQHFLYQSQGQWRKQPSKFRPHKVAHDQLGSQVSLPFPPSIPCMAGRLKSYVHKWQPSPQINGCLMLWEGPLLTLLQTPLNFLYQTSTNLIHWRLRLLMSRLHVFLKGGSLRKPHTEMESRFPTFSCVPRKMVLIGLFVTSNNWMSQWSITILKWRILRMPSLLWPQTASWHPLI